MTEGSAGLDLAPIDGARSTQRFGKAVLADAVAATDPALAGRIRAEQKWRKNYIPYFRGAVEAGARSSKNARMIASNGLASLHDHLEVTGSDVPVREWMRGGTPFETTIVRGSGERVTELEVPFGGGLLRGGALDLRLEAWVASGAIEPSCAEALRLVATHPEWLDLSDQTFVLLGAASEMGPFEALSGWGAHVIAVDLPRQHLWQKIISLAQAGSGTLHVPSRQPVGNGDVTAAAGTDLLTDLPDIRAWLDTFDGTFVLGNHVYADGASFVRVAGAADALCADLIATNRLSAHAYLATPTDVFAVPEEVTVGARTRRPGVGSRITRTLSAGTLRVPNYSTLIDSENGHRWGIADVLVPVQGANYALAKAVQRWRAVAIREEDRILSSANVAPATKTVSVVKNRMLAAAYRGAPRFGVEVFAPETSRALMAAMLVHDIRNPAAAARPETQLSHPYDLFAQGAAHGGVWRLPCEARSLLPLALALGLVKRK